ncbi:MAG: SDR family oxidoreductase [Flavobacteriales bacterium]|nr:SDR family oxidoreductase [Flavobacteriales bacterium]
MQPLALVTGSNRGIGRALVQSLEWHGWCVAGHGKSKPCQTCLPRSGLYIQADLQFPEEAANKFVNWMEQHGVPTLLVHNAGYYKADSDGQGEVWARCMAVNYLSPRLITERWMALSDPSEIRYLVHILSIAALKPRLDAVSYSFSKLCLKLYSEELRNHWSARRFRLINVYPGPVLTDSWGGEESLPEGMLKPEDVARCVIDALNSPTPENQERYNTPMKPTAVLEEIIITG